MARFPQSLGNLYKSSRRFLFQLRNHNFSVNLPKFLTEPFATMSDMKKRKLDKREQKVQREVSSVAETPSAASPSSGDPGTYKSYKMMLLSRGYVVRETLGEGSYSKVKRAERDDGSPSVAIKIIDKNRAPRDYQDRFLPREMKIWPLLNHPHLLNLHAFFSDARRVYMVVDYAENGDVLKYIQAQGSVSESIARKWMLQIMDAVRYMHFHDITHRDLKLENLLLDGRLNIKIGDFGFVKENSSMSLSQTYCGSKSYAAPEILMGRPYDPKKADIWALGVILYIIITGKMPFDESRGTRSILKEQQALRLYWPKSKYVSEDCKNFIHLLFTYDFIVRPSVGDLFANRWFLINTNMVNYNDNNNDDILLGEVDEIDDADDEDDDDEDEEEEEEGNENDEGDSSSEDYAEISPRD